MKRNGMTINDAAHEWVREFNAIPQGMIAELMKYSFDGWNELTAMSVGDTVYCNDYDAYGEIESYNSEAELFLVNLHNGKQVMVGKYDVVLAHDDILPMWGTMWSFSDSADDYWLSDGNGIRIMSQCGFRIYEHEEYGYFFGIDGAGYDFYEAHWVPLYKARGLKWHDEEEAQK